MFARRCVTFQRGRAAVACGGAAFPRSGAVLVRGRAAFPRGHRPLRHPHTRDDHTIGPNAHPLDLRAHPLHTNVHPRTTPARPPTADEHPSTTDARAWSVDAPYFRAPTSRHHAAKSQVHAVTSRNHTPTGHARGLAHHRFAEEPRRAGLADHDDQANLSRRVQARQRRQNRHLHGPLDQHTRGKGAVVGDRDGDGGGVGNEPASAGLLWLRDLRRGVLPSLDVEQGHRARRMDRQPGDSGIRWDGVLALTMGVARVSS